MSSHAHSHTHTPATDSSTGQAPFASARKRDGRVVPFDQQRITRAILRAMDAAKEGNLEADPKRVSDRVIDTLAKRYPSTHTPHIEEIQDVVEEILILEDFPRTAKAYILYRNERARIREQQRRVPEHVRKLADQGKKHFRNPLGEFIYYRTYARWLAEEGRRETWVETVQRYVDFMKENLGDKLTDEEYQNVYQAILNQKAMPSMRLLQFAGKAARRTNVCSYNCSYIAPTTFQDFGEVLYISMCGTGVGFSVESQNVQQLPPVKHQTGKKRPTFVIPDSKEGWADALVLGMKTWFAGEDIDFDFSQLRPAGARLKTMGGKASGPDPLRSLLAFTRERILENQGRRLSNLDVHDILCKIGECVVAGGVRRSALISLSDLDDVEMRDAKKGPFYYTDPQRSLANNSAVYLEKPSTTDFLEEWLALAKSGSGERGIFYRGGLHNTLPERRKEALKEYMADNRVVGLIGTNPCVTEDTWVMTTTGAQQVKDLIGKPFTALVDGQPRSASGFFRTGTKPVFTIKTARGFSLQATENHKILTVAYRSKKTKRTEWKEVQDLKPGDEVVLHNHRGASWSGKGSAQEGWLLGSLLGDGNIEKTQKANLDFWGTSQEAMMVRARTLVHATVGARSDLVGHAAKTGYSRVQPKKLGELAASYGMRHGNKRLTRAIEKTSSTFYEGFLQGWFDADGSVQGTREKGVSVRLHASSLANLKRAQRMLARLGIISTIYPNRRPQMLRRMPDGKGGNKAYPCKATHDLVISGANLAAFAERINFSEPLKRKRLEKTLGAYQRRLNRETFSAAVTEIEARGAVPVYDCSVPDVNAFDANGVYVHNCGEIILQSKQFCNLTEIVARAEDTKEDLLQKIRIATILGTYQATLVDFPYLSKEWKENCEQERLLGVSITGQWDSEATRDPETLQALKEEAVRVNKEYSERFGVNQSTCVTCVKPSGNTSQTVDASSGMHPRHASFYIRRVRIAATDALFKMLRDQGVPFHPEVGQTMDTATTFVIDFPVKAPAGSVFKDDLSATEQLEHWKMVKVNYTEHNPSTTISVGEDEWLDVAHWLYNNWEIIGGLSFLPRSKHVYQLAPYEEIDEQTYNELVKKFDNVDFAKIVTYEQEDETKQRHELACAGGVCEFDLEDLAAMEQQEAGASS